MSILHITHMGNEPVTKGDIATPYGNHPLAVLQQHLLNILYPPQSDNAQRTWFPYVWADVAQHHLIVDSMAPNADKPHTHQSLARMGYPVANYTHNNGAGPFFASNKTPSRDVHRVLLIEEGKSWGSKGRWERNLKAWLTREAHNFGADNITVIVYPREKSSFRARPIEQVFEAADLKIPGLTYLRTNITLFDAGEAVQHAVLDGTAHVGAAWNQGGADTPFSTPMAPAFPSILPPETPAQQIPIVRLVADTIARVAGLYDRDRFGDTAPIRLPSNVVRFRRPGNGAAKPDDAM